MDLSIVSILMLDGITNGAVYALLGLATVLVFSVTRVIFIPQGEFVAYGALTLAIFRTGQVPGTVWLLLIMALLFIWAAYFRKSKRRSTSRSLGTDHLPKPILGTLRPRKRKRRRSWKNRNPTLSQTGGLPPAKDGNAVTDPG